jgi:hypothetical protein
VHRHEHPVAPHVARVVQHGHGSQPGTAPQTTSHASTGRTQPAPGTQTSGTQQPATGPSAPPRTARVPDSVPKLSPPTLPSFLPTALPTALPTLSPTGVPSLVPSLPLPTSPVPNLSSLDLVGAH